MKSLPDELQVDLLEAEPDTGKVARGDLLKGAALTGGLVLAGGGIVAALPERALSKPSPAQDVQILKFALLFERLQAAFYTEAVARKKLRGELRQFAKVVGAHEREHAAFVKKVLGRSAPRKARFHFGNATGDPAAFARAAIKLEDLGVALYNGQAPNLTKPTLAAAAKILSVEARHAAWIRDIVGQEPAPRASDPGATAAEVTKALNRTGFLVSKK
jgi:rubrerythrin